jgi:hypothetical protein
MHSMDGDTVAVSAEVKNEKAAVQAKRITVQ